jgi:replicative DNA helicase
VLRGVDFLGRPTSLIYEAILDLWRGEPADAVTVADELTKHPGRSRGWERRAWPPFTSASPRCRRPPAPATTRIVAERAVLRRLVEAGTRIINSATPKAAATSNIVSAAQAEVYSVSGQARRRDYTKLGDILGSPSTKSRSPPAESGEMTGVPTGFTDLDALTNGHPRPDDRPRGEPVWETSALGPDIARTAAIKHKMASVVFSLEMSKTEITMRLLSAEAQIQLQHMRKGTMRDDDWQRLAKTMGRVSDAPLFIDDSPNMSLMEIRAKCRRLKQRHNLKLVVIDYLQLMSSGKRVESRQQEVSEFSRALKLLCRRSSKCLSSPSPSSTEDRNSAPTSARRCPTCVSPAADRGHPRAARGHRGGDDIGSLYAAERSRRPRLGPGRHPALRAPAVDARLPDGGAAGLPAHLGVGQGDSRHRQPPLPHVCRVVTSG